MLSVIAEHIKLHRHELGQTALFVGSGVVIPPLDKRVDTLLEEMAIEWAGPRLEALPPERRGPQALEWFAREVRQHTERCARLKEKLAWARPSEGHIRLARLIKDGYFPTIFLAEPDRLLEQCLAVNHMEPGKDYHHFVAGLDDAEMIEVGVRDSERVVIVKCAGDLEAKYLPLLPEEIAACYEQIAPVIADTFKVFSLFVAYTERDAPLLRYVPREGGKIFWINRYVPMRDERLYDELKLENPASIEYHRYQPEVMTLLEARHSARHLLCREAGTFNEFFGKLHGRLIRRSHRSALRRRKDLAVLRGGPYRFLDYFDVQDEEFFFGRENDTAAVQEMIKQHPVSVLFGHSGIGKTSLIRAGLIPALHHEAEQAETPADTWLPVLASCQDDPLASIREAVAAACEEIGYTPAGHLPAHGPLSAFLEAAFRLVQRRLLLIVDHFEAYFVHLGARVQETFLSEFAECVKQASDFAHWLLVLREDYIGHLYELQTAVPEIMHHLYRLHRLTREQAEDAIVKPAQNFDVRIERSLVEAMLDDLYRDGVEPAQLEIVCYRLYSAKPRGMHTLTLNLYRRLGGAQKILSEFLDYCLNQLPPGDRRLARDILKLLVTSSEVRVTRTLDRIATDLNENRENVERVLARLVDLRLVRSVGKERERQYELIHEYLADEISQWLTRREIAVQDVQDLLTRQLNNYQKFGLLMHTDELRIIHEARENLNISPEELELILRSVAAEQFEEEYWFGRLNELGERQIPLIQSLLDDPRPEVRLTAIRAASKFPQREYIPQLVLLLEDENVQVQTEATAALQSMEKELLTELRQGSENARAMAVRAVGRLKMRRALRYLYALIEDGDMALREELTQAFLDLAEPRVHEPLLRRLTGPQGLPWTGAYILGHLAAHYPDILKALEEAARDYPELPKIHYALGIAAMQRRDFNEASRLFRQSLRLARTEQSQEAIQAALEEVEHQRQRSALAFSSWPMFHRGPEHRGATEAELSPPLRVLWHYSTKGPIMGSPVVEEGLVFIGSRDGNLYAIEAKRGLEHWHLRTGDRIEGTAAVGGEAVFIGSHDGRVYAVHRENGRRLWQRDLGAPIRSSPTLTDGRLFIGNRQGQIVALRAESGELLWQAQTGGEISAVPACADHVVIVGSWDGGIYAYKTDNGQKLWERMTEGPVASTAALEGRVAYCGSDDGYLYALSMYDGQLYWRVNLGSAIRSSPALAAERIIVGCVDGRIVCLSQADGDPIWTVQSAEEVLASPAIAGHTVYIGSKDGALYALDLYTGEELWRHQTAYGVYSSPAIADGILFIGMEYQNLFAFVPAE